MKPPFRADLRVTTDAEMAGHADLAEALASMQRGETERVSEWVRHPDERVRLTLIQEHYRLVDPDIGSRQSIEWRGLKADLLTQIYEEADREGVAWTPLIDAIAIRDMVATQGPTRERLARIAEWAKTAEAKDLKEAMRAFQYHGFRGTLAQHGGSIPISLALEWADPKGPLLLRYQLSANPSLSPEVVDALTGLYVSELQARIRGESAGRDDCATGLTFLFRGGHRVSAGWLYDLFAIREPRNGPNVAGESWAARTLRWLTDQLVKGLPGVAEEHLIAVVEAVDDPAWLEAAAKHQAAGVETWRRVLRKTRGWKLKAAVAGRIEARRDPEIRELLLGSNAPEVLAAMTSDLPVQRFVHAVRDLAARKPHLAAQMLDRARREQLAALSPTDLSPMFEAEDRSVRLAATTALGALRSRSHGGRTIS